MNPCNCLTGSCSQVLWGSNSSHAKLDPPPVRARCQIPMVHPQEVWLGFRSSSRATHTLELSAARGAGGLFKRPREQNGFGRYALPRCERAEFEQQCQWATCCQSFVTGPPASSRRYIGSLRSQVAHLTLLASSSTQFPVTYTANAVCILAKITSHTIANAQLKKSWITSGTHYRRWL